MVFFTKNNNSNKKSFIKPFQIVCRAYSNDSEVVLAISIILYFIYKFYSKRGTSGENPSKDDPSGSSLEVAQEQEKIAQHLLEVHELEEANRYFGLILQDPCFLRIIDFLKKVYLFINANFNELISGFMESTRILNSWEVYCTFTKLLIIFDNKNLDSMFNMILLGLQQQLYSGLTGKIITALFFLIQIPYFDDYIFLYEPDFTAFMF